MTVSPVRFMFFADATAGLLVRVYAFPGEILDTIEGAGTVEAIEAYISELEQMLRQFHYQIKARCWTFWKLLAVMDVVSSILGNGGSAATASHFALDLAKNTIMPGFRASRRSR